MRLRSIRHRGRRSKSKVIDLDITSLLDILVIMLVFLLKSYNASGVVINVPKDISLPDSQSQSLSKSGVEVLVSSKKIWVDGELVKSRWIKKTSDKRIYSLYNHLAKVKKTIERTRKSSAQAKEFSGVVNLIIDKKIEYKYIKQILLTCAEAGFLEYKFIVLDGQS